ncbi:zinc metalloproteinase nas-14-like [Anopheles bellator]|uniref:zinc metalloproteinase nas-14-like n=1 Tax=Anopheles bellator TaxID=139047 RepID=UPI0026498422|nr:zinc metalloproteinase nas-14-like [Anopheles bellator]
MGTRVRPWELGAGIYREMDIMEKESHQQNGVSLSAWPNARWPNAVVPYLFTGTFTDEQKAVVLTAMAQFAANTCVRFVAQTTETVYISITSSATGCWSYVGRSLSNTYNVVNLQTPSCITVETAAHELMHSIGFYHEFTRPDRDEYVSIDREALAPQYQTEEFYQDNYGKYSDNQVVLYGRPYDYGSVMHYSKYAAAANRSRPVMNNLKPWTGDFGNDNGLSAADIIDINYMYCNATTTTAIPATTTTTPLRPATIYQGFETQEYALSNSTTILTGRSKGSLPVAETEWLLSTTDTVTRGVAY